MTDDSDTARIRHLQWIIRTQAAAIETAGPLLARIGESHSKFADEAMGAFSHCLTATMALHTPAPSKQERTIQ